MFEFWFYVKFRNGKEAYYTVTEDNYPSAALRLKSNLWKRYINFDNVAICKPVRKEDVPAEYLY